MICTVQRPLFAVKHTQTHVTHITHITGQEISSRNDRDNNRWRCVNLLLWTDRGRVCANNVKVFTAVSMKIQYSFQNCLAELNHLFDMDMSRTVCSSTVTQWFFSHLKKVLRLSQFLSSFLIFPLNFATFREVSFSIFRPIMKSQKQFFAVFETIVLSLSRRAHTKCYSKILFGSLCPVCIFANCCASTVTQHFFSHLKKVLALQWHISIAFWHFSRWFTDNLFRGKNSWKWFSSHRMPPARCVTACSAWFPLYFGFFPLELFPLRIWDVPEIPKLVL